jgi:hypothetical protein
VADLPLSDRVILLILELRAARRRAWSGQSFRKRILVRYHRRRRKGRHNIWDRALHAVRGAGQPDQDQPL